MLFDWLIYGLLTWGLTSLLNASIFKQKPASRATAWTLTVAMFVVSLALLSIVKLIRHQVLSDSLGLDAKKWNPVDLSGAAIFAWQFFASIHKAPKGTAALDPQLGGGAPVPQPNAEAAPTKPVSVASLHIDRTPDSTIYNAPKAPPTMETLDEDAIYAAIGQELESGNTDKGLWTRLFAECGGDETQTKVLYIKARADRLLNAERLRVEHAARESAAEEVRHHELRRQRQRESEIQTLKEDRTKLEKILKLADKHLRNPRLVIDEKIMLLEMAGGSFKWEDGSGRCSAIFLGEGQRFSSGKEFSGWFLSRVVPDLLSNLTLPKGVCPNCKTVILVDSQSCPQCHALFGQGSTWRVLPLTAEKR